jgi:hypothetical protein
VRKLERKEVQENRIVRRKRKFMFRFLQVLLRDLQ